MNFYAARELKVETTDLRSYGKNVIEDSNHFLTMFTGASQILMQPGLVGSFWEAEYAAHLQSNCTTAVFEMQNALTRGSMALSTASVTAAVKYGMTDGANAEQMAKLFNPPPEKEAIKPPPPTQGGSKPGPPPDRPEPKWVREELAAEQRRLKWEGHRVGHVTVAPDREKTAGPYSPPIVFPKV